MDKLQVRIGKLLCLFSLAIFVTKLIPAIINNDLNRLIKIDNVSFLIYTFLFYLSSTWKSAMSKIIQISIILLEAVLCLAPDMSSSFFGLSMFIVSIILIYAYGFFDKNKNMKISIFIVLTFCILVFIPLHDNDKKYLYATQWTLFIWSFLFLLWFILKDKLEVMKTKDDIERDKLIALLEQTRDIAHDALIAYEKYFEYNKRDNHGK